MAKDFIMSIDTTKDTLLEMLSIDENRKDFLDRILQNCARPYFQGFILKSDVYSAFEVATDHGGEFLYLSMIFEYSAGAWNESIRTPQNY